MKTLKALVVLLTISLGAVQSFNLPKPSAKQVLFELETASRTTRSVHWSITNDSEGAIFVYDFFLWGPALKIEKRGRQFVFDTTPTEITRSCGSNRSAPVVLLVIGPHRKLQGVFIDKILKASEAERVSMRIAVGSDPYSVVDEVRLLAKSRSCDEDPYNGIVRWGTIIESNKILLTK